MTTTTREQQLEQRVAGLEHTLGQLIRSVYAVVGTHLSGDPGWQAWLRAGASHQAVTDLHTFLQRHPAPEQD